MELNIKFDEKMLVETANRVLDEFEYKGKTIREWADSIANPKTRADRIRSMTDEELAEWMAINTDCFFCKIKNKNICSLDEGTCTEEWRFWLKSQAEEVNETLLR